MVLTVPLPADMIFFDTLSCYYEPHTDDRTGFKVVPGPMHNIYTHMHSTLEFIYVNEGTIDVLQPDAVYRAHAGQLIALAGFVPHGYHTDGAMRCTLLLPPKCFGSASHALDGKMFKNIIVDDANGRLGEMLGLMADLSQGVGGFSEMDNETRTLLLNRAADTFVQIVGALSGVTPKSGSTVTVLRAMEYIGEHYREDIRIPMLARSLYCNQTTLAIQFRRVFGMTMTEYLNRVRAIAAKRMLREHPGISLDDVAEETGFGCIRTMYRVLKTELGTTPAAIVREGAKT